MLIYCSFTMTKDCVTYQIEVGILELLFEMITEY